MGKLGLKDVIRAAGSLFASLSVSEPSVVPSFVEKPKPQQSREEKRKCKSCKKFDGCKANRHIRPNDIACNDYVKRKKRKG